MIVEIFFGAFLGGLALATVSAIGMGVCMYIGLR